MGAIAGWREVFNLRFLFVEEGMEVLPVAVALKGVTIRWAGFHRRTGMPFSWE
jgi:hypothetical protein